MRQNNWLLCTVLTVASLVAASAAVGGDDPASSLPPAAPGDSVKPDSVKPDSGKPDSGKPDSGKPDDDATKFLRVRRDDQKQPVALETAVTRYVPTLNPAPNPNPTPNPNPDSKPGPASRAASAKISVDLIGAVHVGEPQYYDQLNELFKTYDVVLYELVAPEGTRVVAGPRRGSGNPVSFLQNIMKDVLKLEFQLDGIDYSRPNLVHADMSPAEFSQSMKDRGESFLTLFFRVLADSMAVQAKRGSDTSYSEVELLVALVAKDRAYRLKRIMAEQFETMEDQMSSLSGPAGSTLITERNKRALEVLRDQLQHGKQRVAIFYGAGHLSDMEKRLAADFDLHKESQRWLVAWSIAREASQSPVPADPAPTGENVPGAP
ncbi:MAG: TraB/GumN family protein [Pirellulaceae bacterium]